MKVALIQIDSGDDKDQNVQKATEFIAQAAGRGADIVCLAEDFLCKAESVVPENLQSSQIVTGFKDLASKLAVNVVLGSMILESAAGKPTNTSLIIDRTGQIIHRYDKQHMYDVDRKDFVYHESDDVNPGTKLGLFTLEGVTMGVGICVDIRYPEYFRELVKSGAEVVFLPANMRKSTGELAWDILTKARAIENQVFFAACGQIGQSGVKERVGKTRIVSFNGQVLSEIDTEEGFTMADLDLDALRAFRKEFPVLQQMH